MLIDLDRYDGPGRIETDFVIAGGGAAGLSLARQLTQAGCDVVVLEAGGADFDEATQSLYAGADLGMPYYALEDSRLRFLGGTTNIWGGRCVPLQPIDFAHRSWVPHSGWPISFDDLQLHYQQAHADLELGEFDYGEALWDEVDGAAPGFDRERFQTMFWRFDESRERFAKLMTGSATTGSLPDNGRIFLHANVTQLQASADANALVGIQAQSLGGRSLTVVAQRYVLAGGAVENARLLLASNDVEADGIGNRFDQVGRYFMEHPHARIATLDAQDTAAVYALWAAFRKRFKTVPIAPVLLPSAALQEREGILNTALTFKLQRSADKGTPLNRQLYLSLKHSLNPTKTGRTLWQGYRRGKAALQRTLRQPFERTRMAMGLTGLHVMVRAEQAPNPASRVVLANKTDALGVPQADLNWQLNGQDTDTLRVLAHALAQECSRLGLGQLQTTEWLQAIAPGQASSWPIDPSIGNHPIGGYHHMGTTRMSSNPANGVVDADCRVHGYDNLYVAGSSVFPTGGWANPTLTILALGHRLGAHMLSRRER